MEKTSLLYMLLSVIHSNGNVNRLIREGLSFKEIAEMTQVAISKGYVTYEGERMRLSNSGISLHAELAVEFKRTNKDKWIEKEEKSIIEKIDKNFVFLPNQNELHF